MANISSQKYKFQNIKVQLVGSQQPQLRYLKAKKVTRSMSELRCIILYTGYKLKNGNTFLVQNFGNNDTQDDIVNDLKPFIGSSFSGAPGPENCFNAGRDTAQRGTQYECSLVDRGKIYFVEIHLFNSQSHPPPQKEKKILNLEIMLRGLFTS